ncbi:hypothetical protein M406DRAFT_253428 [Cryphonectria parasitica EP155]|uniref:Zn(2)-C6 fungal-type domain-containing protein n=1 Tax=Cryphonectria parasitica (strain ATCC 38755 / EP155) TaxID=660469 RepID=A0A9P4Y6E8_CRYP1|nr:uncharacterized protein M406DRAFT_253428 [Cryphonectria parasitica EP155]KAF3767408.1 hypothetical protein M406DRAFT_253428 [Cryphonectria parasitica EP155]
MQALSHRLDTSLSSLGQRRGFSDLARFSLDLPWPRAGCEGASLGSAGDYPSPPMSGSPPIPPKGTQEADDRLLPIYQAATSHDVYRASAATTTQADSRMLPGLSAPFRPYQPEPLERMSYAYPRPEDPMQRPLSSYTSQHNQILSQNPYLPTPATIPTSGPVPTYNTVTSRPPTQESQQSFASPKSQRKTKGHVAAACVPCKKAHLSTTAQRPCNRCVQNNKEDSCIDVTHKKRGRPRLRDDHHRGAGFDPRLGHSQDPNIRRPMSLFGPHGPIGYGEDHLRRTQPYRVLKSQPPEPLAPRLLERASVGGANIFPPPLQISTRPPEPAAFLTMDMVIAKASTTFLDAIGRQGVQNLAIAEILSVEEQARIMMLQRQIQDDQLRREPNYLPPMFLKQEEEKVFRTLGFGREELAPYHLDTIETLRFTDSSGQIRSHSVRLGLAKFGSVFFIIMVLNTSFKPFPTPSPQSRDSRELGYSYPSGHQNTYGQPTPVSATFEGRGRSVSDLSYLPRQPVASSSSYAASPGRPDFSSGPSAYIPRSELSSAARSSQQPGYQLPPIRSQQPPQFAPQPPSQLQHAQVDIGGLIERPDPPQRHHG